MKIYPTKFEALDGDTVMFRAEAFDADTANVYIDTLMTVELWDEVSPLIRKCLVDMELDGGSPK